MAFSMLKKLAGRSQCATDCKFNQAIASSNRADRDKGRGKYGCNSTHINQVVKNYHTSAHDLGL